MKKVIINTKNPECTKNKTQEYWVAKISVCLFVVSIFFSPSCTKEMEDEEYSQCDNKIDNCGNGLKLGKKIPNPYSLKLMQQAYDELSEKSGTRSCKTLTPTHLYLKFSPKNLEDIKLLEADTSLYFYNYPLDVELIGEGENYHDPSLPDSVPTYQYVCAPINHPLPKVPYEVLDEVYYVENNNEMQLSRSLSMGISWNQLEEKAYLIAGDSSIIATPITRSSQWKAQGHLYYYDNFKGEIEPLVGVPVRMRYHLITYQNCTDSNGYFCSPKERRGDCKYSIEWKRDAFRIRPKEGLSTADYVIQENTKTVNKTFYPNENIYQWQYASMFRAAKFCYYDDILGLNRPENNLEMRASTKDDGNAIGDYSTDGSTEIHIYRIGSDGRDLNSLEIYGTTVHELAHSIHCKFVGVNEFDFTPKCVKEAWTVGVSNYFTYNKYNWFSKTSYHDIYTGLVDDLIDNDKRGLYTCTNYVSGYTLVQVRNALKGAYTWSLFESNIKKIKNNPTENEKIENLFNYWNYTE